MSALRGLFQPFLPATNRCIPLLSPAVAVSRPATFCYQHDRATITSDGYIRESPTERLLHQLQSRDQQSINAGAFLCVSRDVHYSRTGITVFGSLSLLTSMQYMRSTGLQLDCDPRLRSTISKLQEDWMNKGASSSECKH